MAASNVNKRKFADDCRYAGQPQRPMSQFLWRLHPEATFDQDQPTLAGPLRRRQRQYLDYLVVSREYGAVSHNLNSVWIPAQQRWQPLARQQPLRSLPGQGEISR